MIGTKRISIIVPSYNDPRIVRSVRSVRQFDDMGCVRIIVIDGASNRAVRDLITPLLTPDDLFMSEPDRGIFDALNKGLDRCKTEFIGWLGSDDVFTGKVTASRVIGSLGEHDLFVAATGIFRGVRVRRVIHGAPSRFGLVKFGLHNPHFSTFGRASLLTSDRFELGIPGADIAYFVRLFAKRPRVASTEDIATLMEEGGFSTESYGKIVTTNLSLLSVYAKHTNIVVAPLALLLKLGYKFCSLLYYKMFRLDCAAIVLGEGANGSQGGMWR